MKSHTSVTVNVKGDATYDVHPLGGRWIGAVSVGDGPTIIMSTDPAHFEQLADQLFQAADRMRAQGVAA